MQTVPPDAAVADPAGLGREGAPDTAPSRARRSLRRTRRIVARRGPGTAVLLLYVAIAVVYEGRFAVPHMAGGTIGAGPDVANYLWGLRWWPYALGHGINPFISHVIWPPYGANVLWGTTVPALSLLAAPLTLTFGIAVAWNVLCLLAPATAAWGAYALCRELTGRQWPSIVGGALFGFSSYELSEGIAHLQVAATMLVPLTALVLVRFVRGRLGGRGLAVRLGAITVLQFFIAPEILATMALMAAVTALAAIVLLPEYRPRVVQALPWVAVGLLGAGVVLAWPLYVMLAAGTPQYLARASAYYSADLANLVVPSPITLIGGAQGLRTAKHFTGNLAEQGAYLGAPLLLMIAAFALLRSAKRTTWLLLIVFVVAVTLSLGPELQIVGKPTAWLPGSLLLRVPLLRSALSERYALYTSLAAGVMVAVLLATPRRRGSPARSAVHAVGWAWAAVSLAALVPAHTPLWWWRPTPPAIAHNVLGRLIPDGATVIALPFGNFADRTVYAQAVDNMGFNVIDRWMQIPPPQYTAVANWRVFYTTDIRPYQLARVKQTFCALHISYAVAWWPKRQWGGFLWLLHLKPISTGGVWVYRLPACRQRPHPGSASAAPGLATTPT